MDITHKPIVKSLIVAVMEAPAIRRLVHEICELDFGTTDSDTAAKPQRIHLSVRGRKSFSPVTGD